MSRIKKQRLLGEGVSRGMIKRTLQKKQSFLVNIKAGR